jgi:hypothetical protein
LAKQPTPSQLHVEAMVEFMTARLAELVSAGLTDGGRKRPPKAGGPSWQDYRVLHHRGAAHYPNNTIAVGTLIQVKTRSLKQQSRLRTLKV